MNYIKIILSVFWGCSICIIYVPQYKLIVNSFMKPTYHIKAKSWSKGNRTKKGIILSISKPELLIKTTNKAILPLIITQNLKKNKNKKTSLWYLFKKAKTKQQNVQKTTCHARAHSVLTINTASDSGLALKAFVIWTQ